MQVGDLFVKIGSDLAPLRQGLANARSMMAGAGRSMSGGMSGATSAVGGLTKGLGVAALAAGSLAAGAAAAGGWKWLVSGNAEMEQYRQTLNIVLKDTKKAGETMQWAQSFAATTPFEIPDIVEATTRLASYGIKSQAVLGDVGDMAAAMGKPLMQAVEAVADAQTGELERLKEFGISKQMLIDKAAQMGKKEIVNSKGQITNMKALNAALFQIMQERYGGAMKAQSQTLNGMISNLKDWLGTAGRIMGQGVFDKVKVGLGKLLEYLNKISKSGQLEKWAAQVGAAINKMVSGMVAAGKIALQIAGFIKKNWEIILPVLSGVLAAFVAFKTITFIVGIINTIRNAMIAFNIVMAANPIGLVCIAIGLLVAAGVALYRNWDVVKAKALALWSYLKTTFIAVGGSVLAWFKKWGAYILLATPFAPLVLLFTKQGQQLVSGFINGLKAAAGKLVAYVKGFVSNNIVNPIKNALGIHSPSRVTQYHGEMVVEGMSLGIDKTTPKAEKKAKESGKKVGTAVGKGAAEAAKKSAEAIKAALEKNIGKMDKLGDALVSALRKKIQKQEKMQTDALDKEVAKVKDAADAKIAQYDREYNAKLKLIDDEAAAAIKGVEDQISAIDALTEAEEKAAADAEYQNKIKELQKKIDTAKSAEDRADAEKEMSEAVAEHDREKLLEQRKAQVESLKQEIENIKAQAENKKSQAEEEYNGKKEQEQKLLDATTARLEAEKKAVEDHFAVILADENLSAHARKMVIDGNQKEIIALLKEYEPQWQNAGQSFGEMLLQGLNSKKQAISAAVSEMVGIANKAPAATSGGTKPAKAPAKGGTKTPVKKRALGGLETKPSLTFLAENEPEWVIPDSRLDDFIRSRTGGSGSAVVNQYQFAEGAIVIPAKDIAEMQSVSDFFKRFPQVARAMGGRA